jgi:hypothetical protein
MRVKVGIAAVLTVGALLGAGAGAGGALAAGPPAGASHLYVQTAQRGQLLPVRGQRDRFSLVLRAPANRVIWFADRPSRQVSTEPLRSFVSLWNVRFRTSSPNAAIDLDHGGRHHDVLIVTLSKPTFDARTNTVTYPVKRLRGRPSAGLRQFISRNDKGLPRSFGNVALFIDPTDQPPVTVNVSVTSPDSQAAFVMNFANVQIVPGVTLGFDTTGPMNNLAGGANGTGIEFGFGAVAPGTTTTAQSSVSVVPAVRTVSIDVLELPKGGTLSASAGNGPTVTTTHAGILKLPTS